MDSGWSVRAGRALVRPWRLDDAAALASVADDKAVWRNLTDAFPHPYTRQDADQWVDFATESDREIQLAVECEGVLVGGYGAAPGTLNHQGTIQIGYWLGSAHWRQGIMSAVVPAMVVPTFRRFPSVTRLEARVMAWNPASSRVLERAGFVLEGRLRDAIWKDGQCVDELVYGLLRKELGPRWI
jgi:[ribosomal protein S5]-alanine N-acetyltransferase